MLPVTGSPISPFRAFGKRSVGPYGRPRKEKAALRLHQAPGGLHGADSARETRGTKARPPSLQFQQGPPAGQLGLQFQIVVRQGGRRGLGQGPLHIVQAAGTQQAGDVL